MKHLWASAGFSVHPIREVRTLRCQYCDMRVDDVRTRATKDDEWGPWVNMCPEIDRERMCENDSEHVKCEIIRAHIQHVCRHFDPKKPDYESLKQKLEQTRLTLEARGIHVKFAVDRFEPSATGVMGIITFDIVNPPEKTDEAGKHA